MVILRIENRENRSLTVKKRYIVRWSKLKGNSVQNASDHFGVPTSTINDLKNTVAGGKEFLGRGRPSYLNLI